MTEEVLEQKIDNLTEHINNLNVSMRKDDETYKAILAKIARRLDELDTEENLDIVEIKDRLKFLSSQLDDNDLAPNIDELTKIINDLKMKQNISFDHITEDMESSKEHREESFRQFKDLVNQNNEKITDFENKIDYLQKETEEKNNEIIEKVQEINNEVKCTQNENGERLNGLFNELKDDLNNLRENYHELHGLSHDVKNHITDVISNIENKFNDISSTLHSSQDDYKEVVENQINNLHEEIANITETIKNSIVESENSIRGSVYEIVENNEQKYNDILDAQNSMRDEIRDVISTNLDDVKGQIYDSENNLKNAVKTFLDDYSKDEQLTDKLDFLMESVSDINQGTADLSGAVEALKYTTQETCDNTSGVKDYINSNLRDLQEQFVLQMLQLFDNISFSEETEEIIDFVDGANYEIKTELETLQREIDKISSKDDTEFFNEHFNNLCDLVTKQNSTEFDLLKEVASEIKKITASSENEGENTYSLPDVESDLAKIRLILKELQTSKLQKDEQEIDFSERFEILNEDISSISKRTNKLILTSEDTTKKFKSCLDEFKGIMNNFSQRNRQKAIEQKIDSVARLVMSNAKSAQILNEAFMHFAQWIDASSEYMSENKNQMQELNEKFENKIAENKELQMTIEKQNKLISKLEAKVDKYSHTEANLDDETKSMIEYIASQTGTTADNTKDNKNLTSKLEFLEHKISTLSKNIQKIISYIDEE